MARTAGGSAAEARSMLSTVAAAAKCPATNEALAAGEVSLVQAREIVAAEAAVPGSERALLDVAATTGMAGLQEEVRRVCLGAMDRDQLHAERQRVRSVQHWIDPLGMVAGKFRLPPEVGVPFVNRLDAETDRVRRAARRSKSNERREAHAADALVKMTSTKGKRSPRAEHTHGDELCHVVGAGPVPVDVVRKAAVDASVKVVLRDGKKLDTIVHYGRSIPAELRTALELGDPERLDGAVCTEDGCDRRYGLQWDHDDPVANGGPSSYENLKALCTPDHWEKTERDRKAGRLGGGRAPPVTA